MIIYFLTLAIASACCLSSLGEATPYQIHRESAMISAVGAPWSAEQHLNLLEKAHQNATLLEETVTIARPYTEEDLQELYQNRDTIPFFDYSNLMDPESSTHTPAIAFGILRTFNYVMAPNDMAILNVFEKEDAITNGVLLDLTYADLLTLSAKEVGCDLMPMLVTYWDQATNQDPQIFVAYTFIAYDNLNKCLRYTSPFANPNPDYVTHLQKWVTQFGKDFEMMWWATTYLADKQTSLGELADRLD